MLCDDCEYCDALVKIEEQYQRCWCGSKKQVIDNPAIDTCLNYKSCGYEIPVKGYKIVLGDMK